MVIIASSNEERIADAVERLKAHDLPGEVRGEMLDGKDGEAIKQFASRLGQVDHSIAWTSGYLLSKLSAGETGHPDAMKGEYSKQWDTLTT